MNARQKQANLYELKFENFCNQNKIKFVRLDRDGKAKEKFLKNPEGKSPDFLCQKNTKTILVEIKTHTLLTNEARHKSMIQTIQTKKAAGLSGPTFFPAFDLTPELKIPFDGYLRDASKKFKNIKDKYLFPRVLLLDGVQIVETDIHRIFFGENWNIDNNKYIKQYDGLLDSTGSNVSAIVYWDSDLNSYKGIANHSAKISLLEADFKIFFENPKSLIN